MKSSIRFVIVNLKISLNFLGNIEIDINFEIGVKVLNCYRLVV